MVTPRGWCNVWPRCLSLSSVFRAIYLQPHNSHTMCIKKGNVNSNRKSECFLFFFNSTTRSMTVGILAEKVAGWVRRVAASYGKKMTTVSHDRMWYLISRFEPSSPFSVWELHFLPLAQAQPAREACSKRLKFLPRKQEKCFDASLKHF